jgi:phytoene desaturase
MALAQLQAQTMARRATTVKTSPPPAAEPPRACVIGAGLGGLALAIRLQAAGLQTVLVEARDAPGGLIRSWQRDGFTFDGGPALIADPAPLRELWSVTGQDLTEDLKLLEVVPAWRCNWPDGTLLDLPVGPAQLARLAPEDLAGAEEFALWCEASRAAGWQRLAEQRQGSAGSALEALPALIRHQGWRSAAGMAAHLVKEPHLRQALALPVLLAGGNPASASALHLLGQIPPPPGHQPWPEGGMGQLVAALTGRFEALGGTLRLGDPVVRLGLVGNRVTEVECASGWRSADRQQRRCDAHLPRPAERKPARQ